MKRAKIWQVKKKKLNATITKMIQKIINLDAVIKENIKVYNPNWVQIPDHPYRILIIGGSGSGKTNSLFNLTYRTGVWNEQRSGR